MKHLSNFCIAATIVFAGCKQNDQKSIINPPFENIDVPFQTFEIDPAKGDSISLPNGTSIVIPPGVIVDEKGNEVTEKVKIKYREFQNAADIFIAGMPMAYDSAGTTHQFQTAGMFDIQGYVNDKPVQVRKGKELKVNLASDAGDPSYNFYKLDTNARNWNYTYSPSVEKNLAKEYYKKILDSLPQKPVQPEEFKDDKPVIDVQYNTGKYPELQNFSGLMWQYCENANDSFGSKDSIKWIFAKKWSSMIFKPYDKNKMIYLLTLNDLGNKQVTITVKPALKGKNLETAMQVFEEMGKRYEAELEKITETQKLYLQQGAFTRDLGINGFGIYNCDRIFVAPDAVVINADIKLDDRDFGVRNNWVYFVMPEYNSVLRYYPGQQLLRFNPEKKNYLISILQGNKVAFFLPDDFRKLKPNSQEAQIVQMKTDTRTINTYEDALKLFMVSE